jgi:hypothetical protein
MNLSGVAQNLYFASKGVCNLMRQAGEHNHLSNQPTPLQYRLWWCKGKSHPPSGATSRSAACAGNRGVHKIWCYIQEVKFGR